MDKVNAQFWKIVTQDRISVGAFHRYLVTQRDAIIEEYGVDDYDCAYRLARVGNTLEASNVLGLEVG